MDLNVRAFRVVEAAISGSSSAQNERKAAAKKGGLIGGPSRARSMSRERRIEIAKKASQARWAKASEETGKER